MKEEQCKGIASIFMGLGAIIYPISWLYIAYHVTEVGKIAKEDIQLVAAAGIGFLMVGTVAVFASLIITSIKERKSTQEQAAK